MKKSKGRANKNNVYGHFKRQTSELSHKKNWIWIRKGNLKRKSESILVAAQSNIIRTNSVNAKIEMSQQNCISQDKTGLGGGGNRMGVGNCFFLIRPDEQLVRAQFGIRPGG